MSVTSIATLSVSSPAFESGGTIPAKYTCEGENTSPALSIDNIPKGTKSLALILDDPDAGTSGFVHWVMWNIDPKNDMIQENSAPGTQGKNGRGDLKYTGPCPPTGAHHYHFKVYALDKRLELPISSGKKELEAAMKDHILAWGELVALYQKKG